MQHTEALRARLCEQREEIAARLARIDDHYRRPNPADSEELAVERHDDEVVDALADRGSDILRQIDAALGRIESGTFGNCTHCQDAIDYDRLEAIPYTEICAICAEQDEKR